MGPLTIEAVQARLEHLTAETQALQREARAWRRLAGLVLVGAIGVVATGAYQAGPPRAVEAERFVLKGRDGKVRGELGLIFNPHYKVECPQLTLCDPAGTVRVECSVGPAGEPSIAIRDADARSRMTLSSSGDGASRIDFYEKAGWGQLTLGAWADGGSGIKLWGPDGQGRGGSDHGGLILSKDGSTRLNFFTPGPIRGNKGYERVSLGVSAGGKPKLTLIGDNFETRTEIDTP